MITCAAATAARNSNPHSPCSAAHRIAAERVAWYGTMGDDGWHSRHGGHGAGRRRDRRPPDRPARQPRELSQPASQPPRERCKGVCLDVGNRYCLLRSGNDGVLSLLFPPSSCTIPFFFPLVVVSDARSAGLIMLSYTDFEVSVG